MGLVSGFQNVALGGYIRYALQGRAEKIDDLLGHDPTIKGLSVEDTLNKVMNLCIETPQQDYIFPAERLARFMVREIQDSVEAGEPLEDRQFIYDKAFNLARWITDDEIPEKETFYDRLLNYAHAAPVMTQGDIDIIEQEVKEESPTTWQAYCAEKNRVDAAYGR